MKISKKRREELLDNIPIITRILKWAKSISRKDFAEKFVRMPTNNAFNAGGLMDFSFTPHLIKILQAIDNPKVQEVYIMTASQMGKTMIMFIVFAYNAVRDAKSCVWMIPQDDMIKTYQDEKIDPMIKSSPEINKVVEDTRKEEGRSKDRGGKIAHQGSATHIIGSKVDKKKKAISVKIVLVDEADEMDGIASITPLWERAKSFLKVGAKLIVASTKKTKDGTITQGFNSCEQKNFLGMRCPHCSELIEVVWTQFRFMEIADFKESYGYDDDSFTDEVIAEIYIPLAIRIAYYECNACAESITSEHKNKVIKETAKKGKGIEWIIKGNKIDPETVGFSANSFLSYMLDFKDIARSYAKAITTKDPALRRESLTKHFEGYYNEPYEEEIKDVVKKSDILRISNGLEEDIVPDDTYKIFLDIDTQKTHFYYTITAWQYGSICNLVNYGRAETFEELDLIRKKILTDRHGQIRYIDKVSIDSRGIVERTKLVMEWVQGIDRVEGKPDYIYATEGDSGQKMPSMYSFRNIPDSTQKILKINNLMAKNELSDMITRSIEKARAEDGEDGYEHAIEYKERLFRINNKPIRLYEDRLEKNIPSVRTDFERMVTSEHYIYYTHPKTGKIDTFKSWQKINSSVRNDFWDDIVSSVVKWNQMRGFEATRPKELSKRDIRMMEQVNQSGKTPPTEQDHF